MLHSIWTDNSWRNFNYLIACDETGEALAIDPLDHKRCLAVAKNHGWRITQILNTHEHGDHIGGNRFVAAATGAKIIAHHGAANAIPDMHRGVRAGDVIKIGKTIELEILDTPGHTMSHVCAILHERKSTLFSGDTLFAAGAGNCHNGGHPEELYSTFSKQILTLDSDMEIRPGHDYLANNLRFTLDREPGNKAAQSLLKQADKMNPDDPLVTTIGQEFQINTFFRLGSPEIIEGIRERFDDVPANPDPETVFLKLRELRNSW